MSTIVASLTHEEFGIFKLGRHNCNRRRCRGSRRWVIQLGAANFCSLTCEEERKSVSTPTSNWWNSITVTSSRFKGLLLLSRDTRWMDWTLDFISKWHRLRLTNYVGALRITNEKVLMILSFKIRASCSGANADPSCRIIITWKQRRKRGR